MKALRKLLAISLAMIMLMSVFALSSSAIFGFGGNDEVTEYQPKLHQKVLGENVFALCSNNLVYVFGEGETYGIDLDLKDEDTEEKDPEELEDLQMDVMAMALNNSLFFNRRNVNYLIVDDGVTRVNDFALSCYMNCDYIYLPQSLKSIGEAAFAFSNRVDSVDVPSSVELIEKCAFMGNDFDYDVESLPEEASQAAEEIINGVIGEVTIWNKDCVIEEYAFSQGTVLYGYAGSTAEAYALEYGNEFVALDETAQESVWDWNLEEEFIDCTEYNKLIGTDETTGEEIKLAYFGNSHSDYNNDGICDVCEQEIPSLFDFFFSQIAALLAFFKSIISLILPF